MNKYLRLAVSSYMVFLMLVLVFVLALMLKENLELRGKLAQSQQLVVKYRALTDKLMDEWRK